MNADMVFAPLDKPDRMRSPTKPVDPWRPLLPVPADAPQLSRGLVQRLTPPGYAFTTGWSYKDSAGRLLGHIVRYDCVSPDAGRDKEFRPFTFCQGPDRQEWRSKNFPAPRPLYGLDHLSSRVKDPVLVFEGEKSAEAGRLLFPEHVCITSPGGCKAARESDWSPLAGRVVTIWPDVDIPGNDYAADVVDLLTTIKVDRVQLVDVPSTFPEGWDVADQLPDGIHVEDLQRILREAQPARGDGPLPLFPALPRAERYPIEALGPVLSRAAGAISRKVQVPEAIAAQSVLAASALAAQAHADVLLPYGQKRPLSLYLVTVAASGDRKSSADNEALWPIRKREKALKDLHDRAYQAWSIEHTAWNAEKKKIEGKTGGGIEGRRAALRDLGPEPERPLHPFLTAPDPTVEGLAKAWTSAPAALGIFTAEGGQFIGGHGMSLDNRLKTAAVYSDVWDGQPIKRIRAADGVTILLGRRLSMHLMVQPEAAANFLADRTLRDQGLLSRLLVAAPDSIAGSRFYRTTDPADDAAIKAYGARLLSILEARWPLAPERMNELDPPVLTITTDTAETWQAFYDHVESQCGRDSDLGSIQDFAAKAAEHAARIAGVLTIVNGLGATEIGAEAMAGALTLADWYVNEALRLQQSARTDPRLVRAQQLLDWMRGRPSRLFGFREIIQYGPAALRSKDAANEALTILSGHGWIVEVQGRGRRVRLIDPESVR
jgi:hypothetical protein